MSSRLLIILLFSINICFLVSSAYRISDLTLEEESEDTDDNGSRNETVFSQESLENDSISTTESTTEKAILFWTVTPTEVVDTMHLNKTKSEKANEETEILEGSKEQAVNDTTENGEAIESLEPYQMVEENKENEGLSNDTGAIIGTMDEQITLERSNCHLELMVRETQDLKIRITFGKLENNTSGKCCVTLNGEENTVLGVLLSSIHLYQNGSQGEVLQVVTADYGTEFILKEYYSWSKYQPLILTETHRVYITLYYKVMNVPLKQQDSHFNLEVFSYHKHENDIQHSFSYSQSFFQADNYMKNPVKEKRVFIPNFY